MVSSLKTKMSTSTRVKRYLEEVDRVVDAYKTEVELLRSQHSNLAAHILQHAQRITEIESRILELEEK